MPCMRHSATLAVLMVAAMMMWSTESACPQSCLCRWKSGKETVECVGAGLSALPAEIDGGTQVLDVSGNSLQALPEDMFVASGLLNLQRIYLASCKIGRVDDNAFSRLTNLVDLDLSNNLITAVPSETFKDFPGLRRLALNNNPITRIENDAFLKLPVLNMLELSRCRIETVMPRAFDALTSLTSLKIDNNRLGSIPGRALNQLSSLHGIELHTNPWHCDCKLRDLRRWLLTSGIPSGAPPICSGPIALVGYSAEQVPEENLDCVPAGSYFHPRDRLVETHEGESVSMLCRVTGEPEPITRWMWQGKAIVNMSSFAHGSQMYFIRENGTTDKVTVLTVTAVTEDDSGDYLCVAENSAGRFVTNFTLTVVKREPQLAGLTSMQIAGVGIGLALLSLIFFVLVWAAVARWRQSMHSSGKTVIVNKIPKLQSNCMAYSSNEIGKEQYVIKHSNSIIKSFRTGANGSDYVADVANLSSYDRHALGNSIGSPHVHHHVQCQDNKPDVVNVSDCKVSPGEVTTSRVLRTEVPRPSRENLHVNFKRHDDDHMPELQESLNYSPESPPKEHWDHRDYSDRAPYCDYEPTDHKVQMDPADGTWNGAKMYNPSPAEWELSADKADVWDPSGMSNSLSAYDVGTKHGGPCREWREHPMLEVTAGDRLPQSRSQYLMGSSPFGHAKNPNVRMRNLVPVLPPFPPPQPLRVTHSPDEGYEDEGEEGTEV